jgi:hypothetical protein
MGHSTGDALSIGLLRTCCSFPDGALPAWANLAAKRMYNIGITFYQIRNILEEMEISRRARVREQTGIHAPITEFEVHLAYLLNLSPYENRGILIS